MVRLQTIYGISYYPTGDGTGRVTISIYNIRYIGAPLRVTANKDVIPDYAVVRYAKSDFRVNI